MGAGSLCSAVQLRRIQRIPRKGCTYGIDWKIKGPANLGEPRCPSDVSGRSFASSVLQLLMYAAVLEGSRHALPISLLTQEFDSLSHCLSQGVHRLLVDVDNPPFEIVFVVLTRGAPSQSTMVFSDGLLVLPPLELKNMRTPCKNISLLENIDLEPEGYLIGSAPRRNLPPRIGCTPSCGLPREITSHKLLSGLPYHTQFPRI